MFKQNTTNDVQLAYLLPSFLEAANVPRLQVFLRLSLTSYLQANYTGYHQQFVGMMGDLEFLFDLLDDLTKVQESMHIEP